MKTRVKLRVLFYERTVPSLKDFGLVILIILAAHIYLYFRPVPEVQPMLNIVTLVFTLMYVLLNALWYFIEVAPIVDKVYKDEELHKKYSFISKRFKEGK